MSTPLWPLVEIVLVTWNHWADTRECLESLGKLDYPAEQIRIWIVDNASADETVEAIRRDFPHINVIENSWNAGFAHAVNQALEVILALPDPSEQSRAVLLLNNDTLVHPESLRHLAEALAGQPGIAAPTIYYANPPDLLWYAGGRVDPVACRAWHEHIRTRDPLPEEARATDYATGCAFLVSTDVLRSIGLLDEGFFMYWEDADLCMRARASGIPVLWVPAATVWHKVSTSTGGNLAPTKLLRKFASGWRFWVRYSHGYGWPMRYALSSWQDYRQAKAAARP